MTNDYVTEEFLVASAAANKVKGLKQIVFKDDLNRLTGSDNSMKIVVNPMYDIKPEPSAEYYKKVKFLEQKEKEIDSLRKTLVETNSDIETKNSILYQKKIDYEYNASPETAKEIQQLTNQIEKLEKTASDLNEKIGVKNYVISETKDSIKNLKQYDYSELIQHYREQLKEINSKMLDRFNDFLVDLSGSIEISRTLQALCKKSFGFDGSFSILTKEDLSKFHEQTERLLRISKYGEHPTGSEILFKEGILEPDEMETEIEEN